MANFPSYRIVSGHSAEALETEVNHLLRQGYELVGAPFSGMFGGKTFLLQGMLQPPEREEFELPTA